MLMGCLAAPAAAMAQDDGCDVTTGDQVYGFVDRSAARYSRQLASSDLDGRILQFLNFACQDLNGRVGAISDRMDAIAADTEAAEAGSRESDETPAAIKRAASSQKSIDELMILRQEIDHARTIVAEVNEVPTFDDFQRMGLQHVGRETFLESFQQLGDTADKSLTTKYNFAVQISVDTNGKVTGSPSQISVLDAFGQATITSGNAYAIGAYVILKLGSIIYFTQDCEKKLDHQRQRLHDAFELLPTKLPSAKEVYDLYMASRSNQIKPFSAQITKTRVELDAMEERWRHLVALSAARYQTAQTMLTRAKIDSIRSKFEHDFAVQEIFAGLALGDLSIEIGTTNGYLATKQMALTAACGDLTGLLAIEDADDALAYVRAAYMLYRNQPALLPLYDTLDDSLKSISASTTEAARLTRRLPGIRCGERLRPSASSVPLLARSRTHALLRSRSLLALARDTKGFDALSSKLASEAVSRTSAGFRAAVSASANPLVGFCVLYSNRDAQVKECRATGSPGWPSGGNGGPGDGRPYSSFSDHSSGDPWRDILLGARDGGYAEDNRRVTQEIAGVESNLKDRISRLNRLTASAQGMLGEWAQRNGAAMDQLHEHTKVANQRDLQAREQFLTTNAAALAASRQAIDEFTNMPSPEKRVSALLASVGAGEASLPKVPVVSVPPDAPSLSGITAPDIAYGGRDSLRKFILRERRRLDRDIAPEGPVRGYAVAQLELASRLAGANSPAATKLAQALLRDAASVRYFHNHRIPRLVVSVIDRDGKIGTVEVDGVGAIPDQSVLTRVRQFRVADTALVAQYAAQRSAISKTDRNLARRTNLLDSARKLEATAKSLIDSGEIIEAQLRLFLASEALDSELLIGGAVDNSCTQGTWTNCGSAVKQALDSNPSDKNRIIHLAMYWADAFSIQYDSLRKNGQLEKSIPDSKLFSEEVESRFDVFEMATDKARDRLIDHVAKKYLTKISTVLAFVANPYVASILNAIKLYFKESEIATNYDDLLLMNIEIQQKAIGLLEPMMRPKWQDELKTAVEQAQPKLDPAVKPLNSGK